MAAAHESIGEMLKGIGLSQTFQDGFRKKVESRQLTKMLFVLRNRAGITQGELAKRAKWSQSKVSKIENSDDKELSFGDLTSYLGCLGQNLEMSIYPAKAKRVDRIKYHIFLVSRLLNELSELAGDDERMVRGVFEVQVNAIREFLKVCGRSLKDTSMRILPEGAGGNLQVSTEMDYNWPVVDDLAKGKGEAHKPYVSH